MIVWSVANQKGGVGKTTLSSNLAVALTMMGKQVMLLDADLGLANLDIMLGVQPEFTLQDVLTGDVSLPEVLAEGPGGIRYIAGGSGVRRYK